MANLDKIETFSVAEVNARLPLVLRIMEDLRKAWLRCQDIRGKLQNFQRESMSHNSVEIVETMRRLKVEEEALEREIKGLEDEVSQIGGIVRDPRRGVVDFFSVRDGQLIFLVWTLGEEMVEFWHELDAGIVDKRSISEGSPPALSDV